MVDRLALSKAAALWFTQSCMPARLMSTKVSSAGQRRRLSINNQSASPLQIR